MSPKISIIIPLYNKEFCIEETLRSLLSQDFSDYEIVVIDDGSTDSSVERISGIKDNRLKVVKKTNGGPSSARNVGIKEAKGEYIYIIDADDRLVDGALSIMNKTIDMYPSADLLCFNYYITTNGVRKLFSLHHPNGRVTFPYYKWLLKDIHPSPGCSLIKKSSLRSFLFDVNLRRYEDSEFFLKLFRRLSVYGCSIPIFEYIQDTLDASLLRKKTQEDFICCLDFRGKSFFEKMILYHYYLEARSSYPEYIKHHKPRGFRTEFFFRIVNSILQRYLTLRWKIDIKRC